MSKKKTLHDFRIKLLSGNNVVLVECPTYDSEIFVPKIRQGRIVFENLISSRDLINEELPVLKSKSLQKKHQNSSLITKQTLPQRQTAGIDMPKHQDASTINAERTIVPTAKTTTSLNNTKHMPRALTQKTELAAKDHTTELWKFLNTSRETSLVKRNVAVGNNATKIDKSSVSCCCFKKKVPNKRNSFYLMKTTNKYKDAKWFKMTADKLKDFRKLLNKSSSKTKLGLDSRYKCSSRHLNKYGNKYKKS